MFKKKAGNICLFRKVLARPHRIAHIPNPHIQYCCKNFRYNRTIRNEIIIGCGEAGGLGRIHFSLLEKNLPARGP